MVTSRQARRSSQAAQQASIESVPEWGDPYLHPAAYDGFVSFHPPGSEGWPSPHLAYLRPWPPPGATTETLSYSNSVWPVTNGPYADTSSRNSETAYPLSNLPVFHLSGASRPGPIVPPSSLQGIPHSLVHSGKYHHSGASKVDLHPQLFYHAFDPPLPYDFSTNSMDFPSPYEDDTWSYLTTVPPCKWMTLEHPRYPWKIVVTAKVPRQGCAAGVTVRDVLRALYDEFRKEVSPVQAYAVDGIEDALLRQHNANLTHNGSFTSWTSLQRLHWLGTRTVRFLGLTPHQDDPSRWQMRFAHDTLPEKPLPPIPPPVIRFVDSPPSYASQEDSSDPSPDYILVQRDGQIRVVGTDGCYNRPRRRLSRKSRSLYQPRPQ